MSATIYRTKNYLCLPDTNKKNPLKHLELASRDYQSTPFYIRG